MIASAAGPGTQQTAQLPPRPQTRHVTRRGCHLNVLRRGQAIPVPTAPARPTPCRESCDGSPHPCTSQAHPMQVPTVPHLMRQPAHNTRQKHSTALLPPPPDSAAEPLDVVAPLHSYCPLPALPTHCQQFAGDVGTQVGHGSLGGGATFTSATAIAALRPPPLRGAGLFPLLISILIL
jgi:hypothetical protein